MHRSLFLTSLTGLCFRGLLLSLIIGTLLGDLLSFILGNLGPGLGVLGPLILDRSPLKLGDGDLSDKDLLGMFSYMTIRSAGGKSVSSWTGVPTMALLFSLLGVNTSSRPGEKDLEKLSSLSERSFECLLWRLSERGGGLCSILELCLFDFNGEGDKLPSPGLLDSG